MKLLNEPEDTLGLKIHCKDFMDIKKKYSYFTKCKPLEIQDSNFI